jgi:hypothetical protein
VLCCAPHVRRLPQRPSAGRCEPDATRRRVLRLHHTRCGRWWSVQPPKKPASLAPAFGCCNLSRPHFRPLPLPTPCEPVGGFAGTHDGPPLCCHCFCCSARLHLRSREHATSTRRGADLRAVHMSRVREHFEQFDSSRLSTLRVRFRGYCTLGHCLPFLSLPTTAELHQSSAPVQSDRVSTAEPS